MPKVSVIVPVYGVDKYIERCARSLFEQTLDDMEFIFVDDCSPDQSVEILKTILVKYPTRQSQTKILRLPQNKGLPFARKAGLVKATGDYIAHCDSDDWVDTDMYRYMYEKAIDCNADVVVCDYQITDGTNSRIIKACHSSEKLKYIENSLYHKDIPSVWNKLMHRSLYDMPNINYPTFSMAEDLTLIVQLLWNCNSIVYCNQPFYNYYNNIDSISKIPGKDNIFKRYNESISNMLLLIDFFKNKNISSSLETAFVFALSHQRDRLLPLVIDKKYYNLWNSTYPEINKVLIFRSGIPLKYKIRWLIVKMRLYPLCRRLLDYSCEFFSRIYTY